MATLSRGYTFAATELVTNTKLHALVDNATLSGVDVADMDASFSDIVFNSDVEVSLNDNLVYL
jgi:hypothetical protein